MKGIIIPSSYLSLSSTVDDDIDIRPMLRKLVTDGIIFPSNSTYYPIHFAPNISLTFSGYQSCSVFCAYHNAIDISGIPVKLRLFPHFLYSFTIYSAKYRYLYYGIIPDMKTGLCSQSCGGLSPLQNIQLAASHEMAEAITDPLALTAEALNNPGYPLAWTDPLYGEIGDVPQCLNDYVDTTLTGANGVNFTVQKLWSNADNTCLSYK